MDKWLIEKAKRANSEETAGPWMLIARTLRYKSETCFDIELANYNLLLECGKSRDAAEFLSKLFPKYKSDNRFWEEIDNLVTAVQKDDIKPDYHKDIFKYLHAEVRETLLLNLAKRRGDDLQYECKLLLLLFRANYSRRQIFGKRLIEVLLKSITIESCSCRRSWQYSMCLVCDASDVFVGGTSRIELSAKTCQDILKVSLNCAVAAPLWLQKMDTSDGLFLHSSSILAFRTDPWERTIAIYGALFKILKWHYHIPNEISMANINELIETIKTDDSIAAKYEALLLFGWLYIYRNKLLFEKFSDCDVTLALVGNDCMQMIEGPSDEHSVKRAIPMKKRRYADAPDVGHLYGKWNFCEESNAEMGLLHQAAYACISDTDASLLFTEIFSNKHIQRFQIDCLILAGAYSSAIDILCSIPHPSQTSFVCIQMASCHLADGSCQLACEQAINALIADDGATHFEDIILNCSKNYAHATFLIDGTQTLAFAWRLIVHSLTKQLLVSKNEVNDMILAYLLVCSQLNWEDMGRNLFKSIINKVAQKQVFRFPNLLPHIVNLDILEHISFMSVTDEPNKVRLQLIDGDIQRRRMGLSTRHSVKGAKDSLKQALDCQMVHVHETAALVVRNFLIAEKLSILSAFT